MPCLRGFELYSRWVPLIVVALSLVFSDGPYVVPAVHNAARNKLN